MRSLALFCLAGLLGLSACNSAGGSSSVDYKVLTQPDGLKARYNEVLEKIGSHKAVTDEVMFAVSRPSSEGAVQIKGKPDNLTITYSYQSPDNKNRVYQQTYLSPDGWGQGRETEIQVMGAHPEDFRLEDDLFDITPITADVLNKVVGDAKARYLDAAKYKDQYVKSIILNHAGYIVEVHGRLASNDQEKSETYRAGLNGSAKD